MPFWDDLDDAFRQNKEAILFILLLLAGLCVLLAALPSLYFWSFSASVFWARAADNKFDFTFRETLFLLLALLTLHLHLGPGFVDKSLVTSVIVTSASELLKRRLST